MWLPVLEWITEARGHQTSFPVAVTKRHGNFKKEEFIWDYGSREIEVITASSYRYGARNRKPRAHILIRKHKAERVNWK